MEQGRAFAARHEVSLDDLTTFNPEVTAEVGGLQPDTTVSPGTQFVLQPDAALQGPSTDHWFGTDRTGRDMFSRSFFSARAAIVLTVLVFVLMGGLVGAAAMLGGPILMLLALAFAS